MRYGIEFYQSHDAHGAPDVRRFVHDLPDRVSLETSLQDVYRLLRDLQPTRTDRRGVYTYVDPERGSGEVLVLGLDPHELERVQERVAHHELERAIGMRDPMLWDRRAPGARRAWRNPWMAVGLGAGFALMGLVFITFALAVSSRPDSDAAPAWVGVGMGVLIALVGTAMALVNVRRVQWWMRARAAVKAAGLPMPTDLHLFE